jgi:dTDP-4-amino-4,6-dideoxygalactose transaminase
LWNGIKPVFVDIDPQTLNLDPRKVEAAITPQTTAILPVHCYGNPCDVEAIQTIADNYNLKVVYDAAHAFGVRDAGGSILRHGDLSVLSFHATKVFNTFEGGAIVCPDAKTKQHIDNLKNFGFVNETTVVAPGINGKMSEFGAALGLLQLEHIDRVFARRCEIDQLYKEPPAWSARHTLRRADRTTCIEPFLFPHSCRTRNTRMSRDALYEQLRERGIMDGAISTR